MDTATLGLAAATLLLAAVIAFFVLGKGKSSSSDIKKAAGKAGEANGHAEVEDTRQRVAIFYGTQTGTAEKFSKSLAEEIKTRYPGNVNVIVRDLECLNEENALSELKKETLTLFLQATYGDGEPTDSSAGFYKWITETGQSSDGTHLKGMTSSVFGLGNRQYEHFNSAARAVERALSAMGATMLLPIGLGDDDGTLEDDFASWRKALWGALEAAFPRVPAGGDAKARHARASLEEEGKAAPAAYAVDLAPKGAPAPAAKAGQPPFSSHNPFLARATVVRELHSGGGRSCLHVELDIGTMGAKYEAGDHVAILPENSPAVVAEAAALLGLSLDTVFTLKETPGLPTPFPGPTDLRRALSREADLLSPPRKSVLAALAAAAEAAGAGGAAQAERLRHLASPSGKAEFALYVAEPGRSLLEVMRDFPAAKPSLGVFFAAVAPRLAPRFYSISSSPRAHAQSVHVTAAVVRGEAPTGRVHEGVCTTWLGRVANGPKSAPSVPVYLRTSQFRLPADFSKPVIMVGPGTGLAPFRGFLQERAALAQAGCALGPAVLFFGCRSEKHDYIYRDELEGAVKGGAIAALHVAFSRDAGKKVYVQHLLKEQGEAVWGMLGKGAYFYVCGDAKGMAKDVHRTLEEVVQKHGGMSFTAAEAFMKQLHTEGRYQRDVW